MSAKGRSTIHAFAFNASGFIIHDINVSGIPVTADRLKNEVKLPSTTLHVVKFDASLPDIAEEYEERMNEETVSRIRAKFTCDCKSFYKTGWGCSHVFAARALLFRLDPEQVSTTINERRKVGRPRQPLKALSMDDPRQVQAGNVPARVKKLVADFKEHPNRAVDRSVLYAFKTNGENNRSTTTRFSGKVVGYSPEEKLWTAMFSVDNEQVDMDVYELADAVAMYEQ